MAVARNPPIQKWIYSRVDQHDRWDIEELFHQILVGLEKQKELG